MHDGVVTKHAINIENDGSFSLDGRVRREDLKRYLFYWDKVIYPVVNGFGPNLAVMPDLRHLERNGILSLEEVNFPTDHALTGAHMGINANGLHLTPTILAEAQVKVSQSKLDAGEIWCIAQTGDYFAMPSSSESHDINNLEFTLFNCLPIPDNSVSYDDIIDFRISNKASLTLLQKQIESYKNTIINSQDPKRELVLAKKDLTFVANEISSLMQAKKWSFSFESFKSYMEISENSLAASTIGALGASGLSLPVEAGAIAGYSTSIGIKIIQKALQGYEKIPEDLRSYLYLYNANKDRML